MEKVKYKIGIIEEIVETENERIMIDKSMMGTLKGVTGHFEFRGDMVILEKRLEGGFSGKAIYLTSVFDWVLCKDNKDVVCLIPLKKETT